ncbi:hypothetical protein [Chitinophaga sp. sic0106]|uniref:hypothetical protein n=1 Tax=Chitinophaga sp. sic0106 TaxID=2854785 RepID=UPI001C4908DB|nr:hypothetical protein [Chitinophaga sp. sic0106]MBV7530360.1 hypothetical protein [Chitinophaga sp. sic0106]
MKKPWHLLLLISLALVSVAFMFRGQQLYLHFDDTYVVITYGMLFGAAAIVFVLPWLLYQLAQKWLYSPGLSRIHIYGTVIMLMAILGLMLWENAQQNVVTAPDLVTYRRWQTFFYVSLFSCAVVFLSLQLLFVFHLLKGIIRNYKTS